MVWVRDCLGGKKMGGGIVWGGRRREGNCPVSESSGYQELTHVIIHHYLTRFDTCN